MANKFDELLEQFGSNAETLNESVLVDKKYFEEQKRKAKAFDEIAKYVNKKLEEEEFPIEDDYLIGRYESYEIIEEIIKENMEDE
ncbi:hypothetical protein KRP69_13935 [Mammaliicoccus sciuri]|uniref:hypothetical protein n=1 Tax=Mammaliicoccus sciuri TaxID=1296 RepID=UPI001D0CF2D9|nr:hypothetical protein [Mammaliicoccus sciuri]MCC2090277.1 hypothetical protein [Mammaliicoccus sciuri]